MLRKLLLLLFSTTLLVGCGSQTSKKEDAINDAYYSTTIKKAGDDMFDYAGANRNTQSNKPARALDPLVESDRIIYLALPAVCLYMTGSVSEIEGVDTKNHVFEFGGDYEYDFGQGWVTMNIVFALSAKVNKEEGKIFFAGRQHMVMEGMENSTDVFIDANFDFAKNEVTKFELYMQQINDYAYVIGENGEGQIRKSGTQLTPEEAAKYDGIYNNYRNEFAAAYAQKVSSTDANNKACMQKFVETQLYENNLLGQQGGCRIKE